MNQRRGITLVEVLVAIFIMGIGMIALLALFPAGAISIGQALRDDRAAQAAQRATALANAKDLRHDPAVTAQFNAMLANTSFDPNAPSSPVCVDATALFTTSPMGGITRVAPSYATTAALQTAWFTLLDDINFDTNGTPVSGASLRNGKYTWSYLLRRPRLSDPSVVDMKVLVYASRPAISTGETAIKMGGITGIKQMTWFPASSTDVRPNIRNGSWILDVTAPTGLIYGFPYRVDNVAETPLSANQSSMNVTLTNPLQSASDTLNSTTSTNYQIVVLEDVVEVFERGTGANSN